MTAAAGVDVRRQVTTQECQVADEIEDLVAGAFVGKVKRIVDRTGRSVDKQVTVRQMFSESLCLQSSGLRLQDKSSRRSNLSHEAVWFDSAGRVLRGDGAAGAVVEVIADCEAGARKRPNAYSACPVPNAKRTIDHQALPWLSLWPGSCFQDSFDQGLAGTIEPGRFGRIEPDQTVVDLQTGQGGHHVLDQFDDHIATADSCPPLSRQPGVASSRDRLAPGTIDPLEGNPMVGGGWVKFERD